MRTSLQSIAKMKKFSKLDRPRINLSAIYYQSMSLIVKMSTQIFLKILMKLFLILSSLEIELCQIRLNPLKLKFLSWVVKKGRFKRKNWQDQKIRFLLKDLKSFWSPTSLNLILVNFKLKRSKRMLRIKLETKKIRIWLMIQ